MRCILSIIIGQQISTFTFIFRDVFYQLSVAKLFQLSYLTLKMYFINYQWAANCWQLPLPNLCKTQRPENCPKYFQFAFETLQIISSFTAMSQTEFRGWFRFNLNESQMELAWDRMQKRNEDKWGKAHIGNWYCIHINPLQP